MSDSLVGRQIGPYEVIRFIAQGAVGSYYYARHMDEDYEVALKMLPPGLLGPDGAERLQQEIHIVARLDHPHILPYHEAGEFEGMAWLSMAYMSGGSLADKLAEVGALSPEETIAFLKPIASALDYAHKRGVPHRNLTPGNILFDAVGNVYLADFSLPVLWEAVSLATGLPVGASPAYVAPEAARGERALTPGVDIYSLGVILFEVLSGALPFEAPMPVEQLMMHLNVSVPSLRAFNPEISPAVAAVVLRALSKARRERFSRAGDLAHAFARALDPYGDPAEFENLWVGSDRDTSSERSSTMRSTAQGGARGVLPRSLPGGEMRVRAGVGAVPGYPYEAGQPSSTVSARERRRLLRRQARERRSRARSVRYSPRVQQRWGLIVLALVLLAVVWLVVGIVLGAEMRGRSDAVSQANAQATQTQAAATRQVEATATIMAYVEAMGTATQAALDEALTATAQASTPTLPPTFTPFPTFTPTPSPTPYGGGQGLIAYVSERDGDADIFVLDSGTGLELRITANTESDSAPAWSPDGRMLAYHSNAAGTESQQHIYIVDVMACLPLPEGCVGSALQLTSGERLDMYPVWSPDGQQIAYISREGGVQWLRTITLTGEETDVMQLPGDARLLEWAPDGQSFLYYGLDFSGVKEILRVPYVGTSTDRVPMTDLDETATFASYSPDRSRVVYAASVDGFSQLFLAGTDCDLLENCLIRQLTEGENDYLTPNFSPDGSLIVTVSDLAGNLDLYLLNLDGDIVTRLTDQPYQEYDAVWQPVPR